MIDLLGDCCRTVGCKRDADGCDGSVLISWNQIDPWNKVIYNERKNRSPMKPERYSAYLNKKSSENLRKGEGGRTWND